MCIPDRLWYFVATVIAWAYYAEDGRSSPVLRRPSWAPVWLLRGARSWSRLPLVCMVVLGLLLATHLVEVFWLRAGYALCVLLSDFVAFAAYGGHTGFIFLYTALAMLLPVGTARSGVLRLVVAHQLGSPALNKLRIGGWKWLDPSTLQSHLRFARDQELPFKPHCVVEPCLGTQLGASAPQYAFLSQAIRPACAEKGLEGCWRPWWQVLTFLAKLSA